MVTPPLYKSHKIIDDDLRRARHDALVDMIREFGIEAVITSEVTARAIARGLFPRYSLQNYLAQ
jgi:hypothetical protein